MPIETDENARQRFGFEPPNQKRLEEIYVEGDKVASVDDTANEKTCETHVKYWCGSKYHIGYDQLYAPTEKRIEWPHSIFFCYLTITKEGWFKTSAYTMEWDPAKTTEHQINNGKNLASTSEIAHYLRLLAQHARDVGGDLTVCDQHDGKPNYKIKQIPGQLSDKTKFLKRYSWCAYFMDDPYWSFLTYGSQKAAIKFHQEKDGDTFDSPKYAFTKSDIYYVPMPPDDTGIESVRQCAVMINRKHDQNDDPVKEESFCETYSFDLIMRVNYEQSSNGLTLLIDPGGDNEGPPAPPPTMP